MFAPLIFAFDTAYGEADFLDAALLPDFVVATDLLVSMAHLVLAICRNNTGKLPKHQERTLKYVACRATPLAFGGSLGTVHRRRALTVAFIQICTAL